MQFSIYIFLQVCFHSNSIIPLFQSIFNNLLMILKEEEDSVVDYHRLSDEKQPSKHKQLKDMCEKGSNRRLNGWNFKENYTYIAYLRNYRFIFDSAYARKCVKVFRHISKLVKTRKPFQVKSHHQKMMMRHKNVDRIIEYLKLKVLTFLRDSPNSMQDIERINRQCEAFFIEQASSVNEQDIRRGEFQAKQIPGVVKGFKRNQKVADYDEKSQQSANPQGENEQGMRILPSQCEAGTDTRKVNI